MVPDTTQGASEHLCRAAASRRPAADCRRNLRRRARRRRAPFPDEAGKDAGGMAEGSLDASQHRNVELSSRVLGVLTLAEVNGMWLKMCLPSTRAS